MTAKFTKGPWEAKENPLNKEDIQIFTKHGFLTSSTVIKIDESRLDGESWIDMRNRTESVREEARQESNANMYLIKTSPKMYEILEEIVSYAYANQLAQIDWDMIERAQDILEEARGEL